MAVRVWSLALVATGGVVACASAIERRIESRRLDWPALRRLDLERAAPSARRAA